MAPTTFSVSRPAGEAERDVKQQSYWGAVADKLYQDKITMFAAALLLCIVCLTVGASWIGDNVLGFEPTSTNLRQSSQPPTWAKAAWPAFQKFTRACQSKKGCDWRFWGQIGQNSSAGFGTCWHAALGECHWMGTDEAGRDVLTRGLYGGRISLRIGLSVTIITMTLGVILGLISGYYAATFIDDIINAVVLTMDSVPVLFLLIILSRLFQPGPEGLAFLIGIFSWTGISRLIRGQIFSVRERDYILASRSIGSPSWRIMVQHILPNVSNIVIVSAVFEIAGAIIAEASLSYLGVGIGPPLASWGNMMQGSLGNFTDAPWLVLAPGFFIFLTTLSIFLLGDGLRDALDPAVKRRVAKG